MDFLQVYNFDADACENGRWFPFRGGKVLVARNNSKRHKQAIMRHRAPIQAVIDARVPLSEAQIEEITTKAMADAILLGWDGFTIGGKAVEYSPAEALRLLTEYPMFREEIAAISYAEDNFRREAVEADAGNSLAS